MQNLEHSSFVEGFIQSKIPYLRGGSAYEYGDMQYILRDSVRHD